MMFGLLPNPTMILGGALLLVTAYAVVDTRAYHRGEAACEGRHAAALARAQADTIRAADLASRIEAERLATEEEAERLALELEDAAHADPDADRQCLSADSVRRLNLR
jgi:hypothetical protein